MPYAIKVTEGTIPYIIECANVHKLTVADSLRDNMEFNAEDGFETYVVLDVSIGPDWHSVAFTEFTGPDFFRNWKFAEGYEPTMFAEVVRP